MAIEEMFQRMERIDRLIRMRATGSPQQLADRLQISKRQVYRYIDALKGLGKNIAYEPVQQSYYYQEK